MDKKITCTSFCDMQGFDKTTRFAFLKFYEGQEPKTFQEWVKTAKDSWKLNKNEIV